jgi:hypothetical protein
MSLKLGRVTKKDSGRDRKYAVLPITRVTVINVTFRPNDTLLARGPRWPGSPYVRAINPVQPCSSNVPHPTPVGSQANGCGPSWTRASDAGQQVVPVQRHADWRPSESELLLHRHRCSVPFHPRRSASAGATPPGPPRRWTPPEPAPPRRRTLCRLRAAR